MFSRRQDPLDQARKEVQAASLSPTQEINAVSVDLADAAEVHRDYVPR